MKDSDMKGDGRVSRVAAVLALAVVALLAWACSNNNNDSSNNNASNNNNEVVDPPLSPATVTGPVEGGAGQARAAKQDLPSMGYMEEEYFLGGEATSYRAVGDQGTDGRWQAEPDATAAYRTRIIVRRPSNAEDFSGVVVVEWLNVTGGGDLDPDWGYLSPEIIRQGHAWVGVSAQVVGVEGGPGLGGGGQGLTPLKKSGPERYGTLVHPGDAFSYDIFTQAGRALLERDGPAPLGDLEPRQIIAVGESQSAFFLTTYVNAVHPLVKFYDGFLLHGRGGAAPGIDGGVDLTSISNPAGGEGIRTRTDLAEPVLVFETETDVTQLGYITARQDDTDTVRVWEVAGAAHADHHMLVEVYGVPERLLPVVVSCPQPVNEGPQFEVLVAGFHHLVGWVRDGTLPPAADRIDTDDSGIVRDVYGNATGGIRTPLLDVPVAALSGEGCALFGRTTPFDDATLAMLYPTLTDYVRAFMTSADSAVSAGFVLRSEADAMIAEARVRDIGRPNPEPGLSGGALPRGA